MLNEGCILEDLFVMVFLIFCCYKHYELNGGIKRGLNSSKYTEVVVHSTLLFGSCMFRLVALIRVMTLMKVCMLYMSAGRYYQLFLNCCPVTGIHTNPIFSLACQQEIVSALTYLDRDSL